MKREQPRFEFEEPVKNQKEVPAPDSSQNSSEFSDETANLVPAEVDDDPREGDPWHENTKRREDYKKKASSGKLSPKVIRAAHNFPGGISAANKEQARLSVGEHRKKQFDKFYRSMSYDEKTEFMRKPQDERDRIFEDWIKGRK